MNEFLLITKALSDETRVRALLSLSDGELCVCQIIAMLELAPATVSKHMTLLLQAGLVSRRKQGRWHFYSLAGADAPAIVREALDWTLANLRDEKRITADAAALCCVRERDIKEVAALYSGN